MKQPNKCCNANNNKKPNECQQYHAQCQQAAYRVPIVRLPQMHVDLIRATLPTEYPIQATYNRPVWRTSYKKTKTDNNLPWPWRTYAAPWSLRALWRELKFI